jgi:5-methylcytosine-specific restriction endonuclease McrA
MASEKQLRKIWEKTNGHCHFCGDPVDFGKRGRNPKNQKGYWVKDHVIQKGKGGSKSDENCLPACTKCNGLRWDRKGQALRELLEFGIIAKKEIKKSNSMGKALLELKKKRDNLNKRRRNKRR